jgi:hypothetical protein
VFSCRIHPSKDWIQSQIPEIVESGVKGLGVDAIDIDDMEMEAFVQAYVNIVTGACISLGKRYSLVYMKCNFCHESVHSFCKNIISGLEAFMF